MFEILAAISNQTPPHPHGEMTDAGAVAVLITAVFVIAMIMRAMNRPGVIAPPPEFQPVEPDAGALATSPGNPPATRAPSLDVELDIDVMEFVIVPDTGRLPFQQRN